MNETATKSKLKILLVNYEYKGQGGGAGQQMYYMAESFRNLGHSVAVLAGWDYAFGSPDSPEGIESHFVKIKRKNVQLSTPFGLLKFVLRGTLRLRKLTKSTNFDIIQFYFSVPTGILKFGIHGTVPYVVSLRGMDIPGLQKNRYKTLSFLTSFVNKHVARNAASVTCLSKEAADVYRRFAPNIDITVIPNSIDFDAYTVKTSYQDKVVRIVSIGRLVSWKRMDLLIEAVVKLKEKHPKITLDIFGDGYQREFLMDMIKERKAEHFIFLKGFVDKKYFQDELSSYDLFALMSTGDSFGLVFIEAMACGLPVLAARKGGPIEIVEESVTGLLAAPDDLEDTIKQLDFCISNPQKMKLYGGNSRVRVENMYTVEAAAKRHVDLYRQIIYKECKN